MDVTRTYEMYQPQLEEAAWIVLLIYRRCMMGNRGKAATAVTAGIITGAVRR